MSESNRVVRRLSASAIVLLTAVQACGGSTDIDFTGPPGPDAGTTGGTAGTGASSTGGIAGTGNIGGGATGGSAGIGGIGPGGAGGVGGGS
ncbi:MAG TPA: hypothetical protein PKA88_03170, partial [Polyangiaceae bacterium]|nr:hypothetical protein [Polyangiaceae bacterium]